MPTEQYLLPCLVAFLNQACAGQRPVHAWFLEIAFVCGVSVCVCVCVCVCVNFQVCGEI